MMANYEDYTYNAKNLLRRFSHRKRFCRSVEAISFTEGCRTSVLDFGCGDGMFLNKLNTCFPGFCDLLGYEPYMKPRRDNIVEIVNLWEDVLSYVQENGKFNYICCFEVLEHMTVNMQEDMLQKMLSVITEKGRVVLSVPIEKGLPVLVKGILRRRSGGSWREIYSWKNIGLSFLGKTLPHFRENSEYLTHMGFYYTDLERLLKKYFTIEKRYFSPLGTCFSFVNSQVFYHLIPKIS